ncbi:uncharacterized protein ARMOST_00083 [Armillaria ostoyae]|uniref:Uncharacterized protein n=1 Tax=Armillaria ostoyae TaxID=47428 RepID=A0A284QK51_ARMOS|nr:uncharacterized protein ARMOST_00083 [Armillaria ostoyae]
MKNNWEVVHTFQPVIIIGMDFVKPVVSTMKQIDSRSTLHWFPDGFGGRTEDLVLLAGEVHHDRKPGTMRLTTSLGLDDMQPVKQ